ncbi:hypothetical protein FOZ63_006508, partial [Perkinsus olseni]
GQAWRWQVDPQRENDALVGRGRIASEFPGASENLPSHGQASRDQLPSYHYRVHGRVTAACREPRDGALGLPQSSQKGQTQSTAPPEAAQCWDLATRAIAPGRPHSCVLVFGKSGSDGEHGPSLGCHAGCWEIDEL